MLPLIATPGAMEIVLILAVILLLFGATKLPELARGTGRALRIFKAETKGLVDDDEGQGTTDPARDPKALNEPTRADDSTVVDRHRNEPPVS